jgi:integrase
MSKRVVLDSESYKGFTIRKVEEGGVVKYVADSVRAFSKRKRVRCGTKEEAKILCGQWKMTLDGEGIDAWELSDDERFEAGKAFSRMEELGIEGVSLSEIVDRYHEMMPKQEDMTLEQLKEGFLEDFTRRLKKGKSVRTLRSYRYKTQVLVDAFPGQIARLLQGEAVWRVLQVLEEEKGWSPGTVDSYVSVWKAFFSYCLGEGQLLGCPISHGPLAKKIKKHTETGPLPAPVIPRVEDASRLLLQGWRLRDRGVLQGIVVLLFGGLRPTSEMLRFRWSDYDTQGFLHVGGDRSKNEGSARRVELCEAGHEWLDYILVYLQTRKRMLENRISELEVAKLQEQRKTQEDGLGEKLRLRKSLGGSNHTPQKVKINKEIEEIRHGLVRVRKEIQDSKIELNLLTETLIDEHGQETDVLRFKPNDWPRNWKRIRESAGISEWVEDTTRHGWASYSFANHGDQDRLQRELGHCDKRMLNHYLQVNQRVRQKAKDYFSLDPKTVLPACDYDSFLKELEQFKELDGGC